MDLSEVVSALKLECAVQATTSSQYERAIKRFSEHLGRPATVADLQSDSVNAYLLWVAGRYSLAGTSTRNHRSSIIRVWNFASDVLRLAPACMPRRIRMPRKDARVVRAWTLPDLEALITAAETMPGQLKCGIPAKDFLVAWLWVGYQTGFRPSDMRSLTWDLIDFTGGTVTKNQRKTGRVHTARLGQSSLEALKTLKKHGQTRVFPLDKSGVWRWEGFLWKRAVQYGFSRTIGQGIGTLRKTHATEVCRTSGLAAAAESLGHVGSTSTARDHYVDSRIRTGHLPPSPARRA